MSLRDEAPSEFDSRERSRELPVPYVSPWIEFGRNLRALIADLRLNIQAIWRRNREGDLSVPAFWPSRFTSLFWPLLLVLLLLTSFAGFRWLQSDRGVEQRPVVDATPQPNRRTCFFMSRPISSEKKLANAEEAVRVWAGFAADACPRAL